MRLTEQLDSDGSGGVEVLVLFSNRTGRLAMVSKESTKHRLLPKHCRPQNGMPLVFFVRQNDTFNPEEFWIKDILLMQTK